MNKYIPSIAVAIIIALIIVYFLVGNPVQASGYSNGDTINNYYPSTTTITTGISNSELAEGLTAAFANSHQFDFSTHDWQGSVVGAFESEESENAVSFGVGKRFKKLDALVHGSFTQTGGDTQYYVIGTTFRF